MPNAKISFEGRSITIGKWVIILTTTAHLDKAKVRTIKKK